MAPKKMIRSRSGKGSSKGRKKSHSPASQERTDRSSPRQGHPEDIVPLVLTSATQKLLGCLVDEDVTEQSPYKLLKKDNIIQDIKSRAAVSDFSPVKQIVLDYPEDEILLVFDPKLTYGRSFYLVLTPEAKDQILRPPETETPEDLGNEVNKTPEPKPWISLGSETEIEEESVKETREKLKFIFFRKRESFGLPFFFSGSKTTNLECPSYEDQRFSIKVMLKNCSTQAAQRLQDRSAQTHWSCQRNASTQYTPKDLNQEEKERIFQDESIKTLLKVVTPRMLDALQQGEISNVFFDDCKSLEMGLKAEDQTGQESMGLLLHKTFTVHEYTKNKIISCVNCHPTIYGMIAVALTERMEERSDKCTDFTPKPSLIVFYNLADSSKPQLLLEGPDDITAFEFCPSNANIIVGGCVNGQVALWDISAHVTVLLQSGIKTVNTNPFDLGSSKEKKIPVVRYSAASAFKSSHRTLITDVQWLPETFEVTRTGIPVENQSKVSVQVITCSPDCTLLFWDVRLPKLVDPEQDIVDQKTPMKIGSDPETFKHLDRTWKPLLRVLLSKTDGTGEYISWKFSVDPYTSPGNAGSRFTEGIPDYSQLRIPSAETPKTLEDVNTKIYVGTLEGEIVYIDWKSEKDVSGRLYSVKPLHCFSTHNFMVNTVQRSPFLKDIILTIGTWNFAISKEGVTFYLDISLRIFLNMKSDAVIGPSWGFTNDVISFAAQQKDGPLFVSRSSKECYTAGCWSLSRPAVFFIGKEYGTIEVWNLLENTSEPSQVHTTIINSRIICIKPWIISSKLYFLVVAEEHGVLQVVEISKNLCVPFRDESLCMKKYFEREAQVLEDFLNRQKSWANQKKKEEELKRKPSPDKPVKTPKEKEDLELKEHKDFLMLEESILKSLGMWTEMVALMGGGYKFSWMFFVD